MKWADLIEMLQKYLDEFYVLLTVHLDIIVVKKNQLDAQLILSIFCQHLHVSGVCI
jgi:ribosomal protein S3